MKKLLIFGLIVLVIAAIASPLLLEQGARMALSKENREETWAPGMVYYAAIWNMRTWRYETAASLWEDGLEAFAKPWWGPEGVYRLAVCYEAMGERAKAQSTYRYYLAEYSNYPYATQARKRLTNLEAAE